MAPALTDIPLAVRIFGPADQAAFADLSGDRNPIHLDPLAARRTQAGAPVVHGVNAILWALDELCVAGRIAAPVATLKASFQKFIYLDAEVELRLIRADSTALRAELAAGGVVTSILSLEFGPDVPRRIELPASAPVMIADAPAALSFPDITGRAGTLQSLGQATARLYPCCAAVFGAGRVDAIARLSTLVGMVCPGLRSIFSGFDLRMVPSLRKNGLGFRVRRADERFRVVDIEVAGDGIEGAVTAFLRQAPVSAPPLDTLSPLVGPDDFRGVTALVIGGSRGLGAAAARIIAVGGGRTAITYVVGSTEACETERACAEAVGPGSCRVLRYDAREDAAAQLTPLEWPVNQLYYFATPAIFRPKAGFYTSGRFAEFCRIYVDGFAAAVAALRARGTGELSIFYPSSVALDGGPRDMLEYCMAKAAGEALCAEMNRSLEGTRVLAVRLPRVWTDQTAVVAPSDSVDPVSVLLPIIRRMTAEPGRRS
jgi:acyl dehydratase/NAD(P)-dependent dehydrogenase (short-subunit alcohol dehydrogenase family)